MNIANLAKQEGDMKQVNIFDAKTELSKLIKMLENNEEDKIIIARSGKPVAQILPYSRPDVKRRIGIAKGLLSEAQIAALTEQNNVAENSIDWESLNEDFT